MPKLQLPEKTRRRISDTVQRVHRKTSGASHLSTADIEAKMKILGAENAENKQDWETLTEILLKKLSQHYSLISRTINKENLCDPYEWIEQSNAFKCTAKKNYSDLSLASKLYNCAALCILYPMTRLEAALVNGTEKKAIPDDTIKITISEFINTTQPEEAPKVLERRITPPPIPVIAVKEVMPPPIPVVAAKEVTPPPISVVAAKEVTPPPIPVIAVKEVMPPPIPVITETEVMPTSIPEPIIMTPAIIPQPSAMEVAPPPPPLPAPVVVTVESKKVFPPPPPPMSLPKSCLNDTNLQLPPPLPVQPKSEPVVAASAIAPKSTLFAEKKPMSMMEELQMRQKKMKEKSEKAQRESVQIVAVAPAVNL